MSTAAGCPALRCSANKASPVSGRSGSSNKSSATLAWRLGAGACGDEASSPACGDVAGRDQGSVPRSGSVCGSGGMAASLANGGSAQPCGTSLLCGETDIFCGGGAAAAAAAAASPGQSPPPRGLDLEGMIRSHRRREAVLRPNPHYMEAQASAAAASGAPADALTPQMRMIVASWMVEVADEFSLQPETLHLAVALLDRFLAATVPQGVPRGVLQLVAVACIMVAAKDLEVNHPTVEQLVAIAANCFSAQDLLRMERVLLDALDFSVANHTAFSFLHLYAQGLAGLAPPVAALAVYLLELVLLDYSLLEYPPSQLAAAALLLAMHTHGCAAELAPRLLRLAGYAPGEVARCVGCLLALHRNATWPANDSLRDLLAPLAGKYSQQSWCCAALCPPLPALDAAWFAAR
ncbi:G2 mitotic-specific cyclin-A [Raphidocelis subcapitata]|uniref:G2 mitotic-specific cyclin-A n=1 Tax=Raphidocelis subcapitata TaxID=307507 RepID=A0A2V0NY97_9CHLO|nr:G2 mitotic-specific cyclin-A [Raphidocelis subcapitata]|eukprot:GBF92604.1 G2 mitotic-specific cyclin-A [Raphidocelis subcapitata]